MITPQVREASSEAINFFGVSTQQIKAIEEMSELCIELARFQAKDTRSSSVKVAEELADVIIVLSGLYEVYNADGWVDGFLDEKSKKLLKMIRLKRIHL